LVNKTPAELDAGTPSDTSIVHASENGVSSNSKGHVERDISRLQGTAPLFSASKDYNIDDLVRFGTTTYTAIAAVTASVFDPTEWREVGNCIPAFESTFAYNTGEIVNFSNNNYRATTDVTAGAFDRDEWKLVWETLDVVRVFTQADLPDLVSGFIPLEDGKDYRFTEPINLTNPLLLPIGGTVALTSESKLQNMIDTDGVNFVNSNDLYRPYTVVADSGGDLLFTVPTNHLLTIGDLVNIQSLTGTDYSQIKATVIATPSVTTFTIDGTFVATGTGNIDKGCLNILVRELGVSNSNPTGGITAFEINMTRAQQSFLEFTNNTVKDFLLLGPLTNASELYFEHNQIFSNIAATQIIRCEVANIADNYFEAALGSSNSLELTGEDVIQHYTVSNCTFNPTPATFAAILVDPTSMSSTAHIAVFNCIDLNSSDNSLFDTSGSGIDETDPRLTVNGNVRQKNSLSAITVEFPFGSGPLAVAVAADTLTAVSSTSWIENFAERFSLDTGAVTGEFTYEGLETAKFLITYHTELTPESDNQELFTGIFKNATEITESRFTIDEVPISESTFIGHSFITELETDDVLRFGVGNVNTAEDVSVANMATISVTRIT